MCNRCGSPTGYYPPNYNYDMPDRPIDPEQVTNKIPSVDDLYNTPDPEEDK